jgi:glycolate oxidase FAD binding subunit
MRYGIDRRADNSIADELCRKRFDPGRSDVAVPDVAHLVPGLVPDSHAYRRMFRGANGCEKDGRDVGRAERLDILKIRDAGDVEQAVRAAIAAEQPLEIIGHGTRRQIGQPMATNAVLDLSALNAVSSYEPNELIITVQAGAPLADVMSLIDAKNQQFAFEPVDTAPLLGSAGAGTIGGMIGAGLAGPRRVKAGGARDHLLGAHAVSGFGDSFKTGGKVVKNVTGYDLCKLLAGSWGTLAVMTEVTLKVMPKPESERTLVLRSLDHLAANKAMTAALGSPYDVSGAAHLPSSALRAEVTGLDAIGSPREAVTLIRLEGILASVSHRAASLVAALKPFGKAQVIEDAASAAVWAAIRDVLSFAADGPLGAWPVWRIVCPPASGGALGQALARETGGEVFYDWGGGLIWAALPPKADAQAALVRQRVTAAAGHATLLRAGEAVRRQVDVFQPQAEGLRALSERVRNSFDPKDILNRGRTVRRSAA